LAHGSGGKSFRNKAGGSERATQGQEQKHEEKDALRAQIAFIVWLRRSRYRSRAQQHGA
jgi:hypothetical protein